MAKVHKKDMHEKDTRDSAESPFIDGLQIESADPIFDPARIMRLAQRLLGMSTIFYTTLNEDNLVVAGIYYDPNANEPLQFQQGDTFSLVTTYCHYVCRSSRPLVISDVAHPKAPIDLLVRKELPSGSYVGVPLIKYDGSIFGSLCGIDTTVTQITAEQVTTLQLFAHALMVGIERNRQLQRLDQQRIEGDLAYRDKLTGLLNRRAFDHALETEFARASLSARSLALIFIDLDHFKACNELHGHRVGDVVLQMVATRFTKVLRDANAIYRFGGEEMVVLLPQADERAAMVVAEQLRATLHTALRCAEQSLQGEALTLPMNIRVTASLGVAIFPADAANIAELVKHADAAMYLSKRMGRDRVSAARYITAAMSNLTTHAYTAQASSAYLAVDDLAAALATALAARDGGTGEHADRLIHMTEVVIREMGHDEQDAHFAGVAARLHDIGKLGISDAVLLKPGPLNDSEWDEMRRHPAIGAQILNDCGGMLSSVGHIVEAHHERWDGTGYPHGLKGEAIPLAARVIAVIDAFDAMTSDRPYRNAMPLEDATHELQHNAGTQFDPLVVAILLNIVVPKTSLHRDRAA